MKLDKVIFCSGWAVAAVMAVMMSFRQGGTLTESDCGKGGGRGRQGGSKAHRRGKPHGVRVE